MFGTRGKRPTIALSMIVKNESAVIRRCLRSVKPLITSWAISDTGSTDGTQDIIREELAGIPGELIERPWVGFTPNRNEALEMARKSGADYLLVIDADEEFTADPGFTLEGLVADTYSATFRIADTNARWPRCFLIKASTDLAYAGDMDETIQNDGCDNRLLENCLIVSYPEGFRSRDGLKAKFERDVTVLQESLAKDPENPRTWFYLAQRLGGCERFDESVAAYRKRLEFKEGNPSERFQSAFQIAQTRQQLGHDWRDVVHEYVAAVNEGPNRAEPLFYLGCLYADHAQWAPAELYMRAAARMPRPIDSQIVIDDIYSWLANDTLAGILGQQGRLREARELLTKLVALPQCPESERRRIRENIAMIRETEGASAEEQELKLGPDERAYVDQAATVAKHGLFGLRAMARQYLTRPALHALPSPVRWAWLTFFGFIPRLPLIAALACVALAVALMPSYPAAGGLAALSPLLAVLARRRLQDTTVAALTLAAVFAATRGGSVGVALSLFFLLGCKEASLLAIPAIAIAWLASGHGALPLGQALASALVGWSAVTFAIFGRMTLPLLTAGAAGHATPYTLSQQRGAPHRLLVDLVLASPFPTVLAVWGAAQSPTLLATAVTLIAAHALAPVRNVRLVLAADMLIRVCALTALFSMPVAWTLAGMIAWIASDAFIYARLQKVYDPTTEALAGELGMTRLAST